MAGLEIMPNITLGIKNPASLSLRETGSHKKISRPAMAGLEIFTNIKFVNKTI